MKTFLKLSSKKKNIHRVPLLPIPTIKELELLSKDDAAKVMEEFFLENNKIMELNKKNFEKAMKRISLCSYIHGILNGMSMLFNPFNPKVKTKWLQQHYSWCPHDEWMNNNGLEEMFGHLENKVYI